MKRYGYAYDPAGNRTTARTDDTPLLYAYNPMNRLTSQSGGGVVALSGRTNEPASVTVAGTPARGAGSTVFAGSAVLASGTSTVALTATDASGNTSTKSYEIDVPSTTGTFAYDANGNLTQQGTKTYEWDAQNRLTRVLDSGTEIARFVYDGDGRRVQKIAGSVTHSYVLDGMDVLQDRIGTGTTSVTRTVHGPGIDEPLASFASDGTVSYYLADHLGSIVQQTNAAGAVTLTRQYDPYGVPLQGGGTSGYAFTGQQWDAETALMYSRARYYSAELGRFLSDDPAGLAGGANLQQYVSGNPVRFVDPFGLCAGEQGQRTTPPNTSTNNPTIGPVPPCDQLCRLVGDIGNRADPVTHPSFYAEFFALSAIGGVAGQVAAADLGPEGPIFGTRYKGNNPLLNSNDNLRIGWSYIQSTGEYTFRIAGQVVAAIKDNPHINLWPPSWWFK